MVYVVSNFLSDKECEAFVELGKGKMERATVITDSDHEVHASRTNDYCFMMRRNRMWESASFISNYSSDSINNKLVQAGMKEEWVESINNFITKMALTFKAKFGEDQLPNVIPIKKETK